ncbi:restriction endonuclease subunit S [bacterium 1XD42-1]|nr:restriction endonuclease subunit S [bacterium 1XD42-1]
MTAQQLKNSILQMAVQGKLVPQNPNDEPASILLERIRAEKERLIREKKIKQEKNPSIIFRGADNIPYEKVGDTITPLEIPFEIPESWEWVRLGSISTYAETKQKLNATSVNPSIWGLDLEDIEKGGKLVERKTVGERKAVGDKTVFTKGDILYSKLRPYLLKILVAPDDGICTPEIVPFRVYGRINPEYIVYYLKSPYVDNLINSITYGVKMPRVGREIMTSLLVPVPPLGEQHRIVVKIKELMPFLEKHGEMERELSLLNSAFPETLKKSILQQAVQGKLVPQDPTDEPAEVLLKRIRAEKQRLVREGKIKKDKRESIIFRRDNSHYELVDGVERCIDEELPFQIPENWAWVRLADVCEYIQRGKSPKYSTIKKYPVIAQKCNQWSGFSIEKAQFIEPDSLASYGAERILQDNDLMWNSTGLGTLGRIAIYKVEANPYGLAVADSHVTVIRLFKRFVLPEYLYFYFSNPTVQSVIEKQADGTTKQKELATATIKAYWIPIPPLSEQHRIVAKIEELLPLIQSI